MSRFTGKAKNGNPIAWGYDRQLGEYFLQEFMSDEVLEKHESCVDEKCPCKTTGAVFSIMSHTTTQGHPDHPGKMDWSNGELLELMKKYPDIPRIHRQAIASDLPF